MKAILIGDNITSLVLAKCLVNNNINVSLYSKPKLQKIDKIRTISISKKNLDFIQNSILKISNKYLWDIDNIQIYQEYKQIKKILDFKNNDKKLFSIVRNIELYNLLNSKLKTNKRFKKILIKKEKNLFSSFIKKNKSDIIFNCDKDNEISKMYSGKGIKKNYLGKAYVSIIKHEKIQNNTAYQIFTRKGPIAFLPTSNYSTSIVFSMIKKKDYSDKEIIKLINFYNLHYKILSIGKIRSFNLKFDIKSKYINNNILQFGDSIHQIHPLAGQGFNMTLRDIKEINRLVLEKNNLGLRIDSEIFKEFEKSVKHKNLVFATGIDYINNFFSNKSLINKKISENLFKIINNNKVLNKIAIKFADSGLEL